MAAPDRPPSNPGHGPDRQLLGSGIAFLGCGIAFFAVGIATRMAVFAMTAPAFIALGIVFLVRARRRPDDRDPR